MIEAGADIVMLPYFKSAQEAEDFIDHVAQRAETCLLVETMEAVDSMEEIVALDGIDYIHVGLNDIHLQRGTQFMFEFLSDGLMDQLAGKNQDKHIPFGFGGVGRTGALKPTGARILGEHSRLGSTGVILSRAFINIDAFDGLEDFAASLRDGVNDIRECLQQLETAPDDYFEGEQTHLRAGDYGSRRSDGTQGPFMIRLTDVLVSFLALLALSPLLAVTAILLRATGEGEVFFRQKRIGRNGDAFFLIKFATMRKDSPSTGAGEITLLNDERVLPVGRFFEEVET